MANNKTKDYVAQQQGGNSFVKAKMDSANIDKVHLSFVKHSGKPECKQLAAIEGYLSFNSVAELFFFAMSRMERECVRSKKTAAERGNKYAENVWSTTGGSSERRDANGTVVKPCRYYGMQISPGSKADVVLQIREGEGEVTETGGFMLKKGAQTTNINVPFSYNEFGKFIVLIHDAVQAYLVCRARLGLSGRETNEFTPYKPRVNSGNNQPESNHVQPDSVSTVKVSSVPAPVVQRPIQNSVQNVAAPETSNVNNIGTLYVVFDSFREESRATDSVSGVMRIVSDFETKFKAMPEHYRLRNSEEMARIINSLPMKSVKETTQIKFISDNNVNEAAIYVRRIDMKCDTSKISTAFIVFDSFGKSMIGTDSARDVMRLHLNMRKSLYNHTNEQYRLIDEQNTINAIQNAVFSGDNVIPTSNFISKDGSKKCFVFITRLGVTHYGS